MNFRKKLKYLAAALSPVASSFGAIDLSFDSVQAVTGAPTDGTQVNYAVDFTDTSAGVTARVTVTEIVGSAGDIADGATPLELTDIEGNNDNINTGWLRDGGSATAEASNTNEVTSETSPYVGYRLDFLDSSTGTAFTGDFLMTIYDLDGRPDGAGAHNGENGGDWRDDRIETFWMESAQISDTRRYAENGDVTTTVGDDKSATGATTIDIGRFSDFEGFTSFSGRMNAADEEPQAAVSIVMSDISSFEFKTQARFALNDSNSTSIFKLDFSTPPDGAGIAVPEPGSFALLAGICAFASLALRRRS